MGESKQVPVQAEVCHRPIPVSASKGHSRGQQPSSRRSLNKEVKHSSLGTEWTQVGVPTLTLKCRTVEPYPFSLVYYL